MSKLGALSIALVLGLVLALMPVSVGYAQEPTTHVVRRGETLYSIARRYGTTVSAIMVANGLANPNRIYVGQRLVIPGRAGTASTPPSIAKALVIDPGTWVYKRDARGWHRDEWKKGGELISVYGGLCDSLVWIDPEATRFVDRADLQISSVDPGAPQPSVAASSPLTVGEVVYSAGRILHYSGSDRTFSFGYLPAGVPLHILNVNVHSDMLFVNVGADPERYRPAWIQASGVTRSWNKRWDPLAVLPATEPTLEELLRQLTPEQRLALRRLHNRMIETLPSGRPRMPASKALRALKKVAKRWARVGQGVDVTLLFLLPKAYWCQVLIESGIWPCGPGWEMLECHQCGRRTG